MRYLFILALMTFANVAQAQSTEGDVIRNLETGGYELVDRRKSWLGRIILDFRSDRFEREIILNPVNGEILRDYSEPIHVGPEEENWWNHLLNPFGGDGD